jgi:uncharacterized membrane protein
MKNIFRKAMTIVASTAMIGATVGIAAAASYPTPFTSNTAVVTGASAAPSDNVAAAGIVSDLNAASAGSSMGTTTVSTDGESYKFEKTSTKFHLGDTITGVVSSDLDEDDLPELLADGTYIDDDNDEFDFTQKISMSASTLSMFEDNDYAEDEPTVGFRLASGASVLTYTLEFTDEPSVDDLETTDLTMMGKNYYVLERTPTSLTLLDSATDTVLTEGETATITAGDKTYTVSINFVSSTEAKLTINGENTNSLNEGETYKLSDGSYVGIKDILYNSKDTGVSKVEFSIGGGKMLLTSGQEVELNDDDVDGLTVTITNTTTLDSIALAWAVDEDSFVTPSSVLTMPGFETVTLAFEGLTYPAEEEINLKVDSDNVYLDNFPLISGEADIDLLYTDGTSYTFIGKDSTSQLRTGVASIIFDGDTDDYFVASWNDGSDAESYLMRASGWDDSDSTEKVDFEYYNDGSWVDVKTGRESGDTFEIGNVELVVGDTWETNKTTNITRGNAQVSFDVLYSAEGLQLYLPSTTSSATGYINFTATPTTWIMNTTEEDKDGDIAMGDGIDVTFGLNSETTKQPTVSSYLTTNADATSTEIGETDVFRDFTYSDLATEILWDKGDTNQYTLQLVYHGDEVQANVYLTTPGSVSTEGGEAGVMSITDAEVSTKASGKNLIVVGGSAINSVAADLLGGAYRGEQFTSMTGVGDGEFLIQSFAWNSKTALLVAGYNAADTTKAATYLQNYDVDTTVGMKYEGTSATEASLVVA